MSKIESRIGKVAASDEIIYRFISDFRNFKSIIPQDKIQNWEANQDDCSFVVPGIGNIGLKFVEKAPFTLVKISALESSKFDFFLWVQLKQLDESGTNIKITIKPEINIMMMAMVKKPLKKFVDTLVDYIEKYPFTE